MSSEERKIADLREGLDGVTVRVRVIEASDPKVIQTRKGPRVISEAIVGDDSGKIKLTLWGKQAGQLQSGDAVEVKGAWTTSYRGEVQLNVGSKGEITSIPDDEVPKPEDVPDSVPKASERPQFRRGAGGFRSRRPF